MMTVLITGASSGIGAGLAKSFAADGHPVIACGRDPSRLAALQRHSPNISLRSFDMTDREACRQALAECRADLIILCAGTCEYLDHGTVDAALVERTIATNFLGPVNCLEALQPRLSVGNGALAALSSRRGVWRLQSGVNLVCQQPAPGLGAERHCHHGGLAGIRRYPADAQKRFFHARPGERGARGKGDSPRSGER